MCILSFISASAVELCFVVRLLICQTVARLKFIGKRKGKCDI